MTFHPIEVQIDAKSAEILQASQTLDAVLEAQYRLKKEIVEMNENCRKARFVLARLKEERKSLEREFWRNKNL